MESLELERHAHLVGQSLPFALRDMNGRLLLARGQSLLSRGQLDLLVSRGAVIDRSEADRARASGGSAATSASNDADLDNRWESQYDQVGRVLNASLPRHDFKEALDAASQPIIELVETAPDVAISQVVRQSLSHNSNYSRKHAVHTAIATVLAGERLGWDAEKIRCGFRAALTMNISITDLQNRLASQVTPLTDLQKEQIRAHPQKSEEFLRLSGVTDKDWLDAVLQHHESRDGLGYPFGRTDAGEIGNLIHCADVFTAKFNARSGRAAVCSDAAARQLFGAKQSDISAAALIKEFGMFPPGTAVRLKSGETAMVVKRGETPGKPVAMALTNRHGEHLLTPLKRDTNSPAHVITAVLPLSALRVRVSFDQLRVMAERC
jgi:HD-GYP domain-containing protein (c-di-GMP phosphodiesterase class II)